MLGSCCYCWHSLASVSGMSAPRIGSDAEASMEYLINGLIAFGLLVYLGYALLKPERF